MANEYTHGHHESVLRSHRWRTAENSAGYLLPLLRPGMRLLDIGCGPGTITMDLAELVGPEGRVTALERTDDALGLAREEARRREVDNVDFVVGDVQGLDLPDGAFDVVHAHQVLQHVDDPVRALREMGRVGRPGGIVAARDSDYGAFTWFPEVPELDRWLELYLAGGPVQRRRAGRRPPAAVVGAGRGVGGRDGGVQHLVLRDPDGPGLVGRHVGRPDRRVRPRAPGPRARVRDSGRARGDRGGLAPVGGAGRRLVQRPARRDPRPRLRLNRAGAGQTCTGISSPRLAPANSWSSSPDQKLPGSYQFVGRSEPSRPISW